VAATQAKDSWTTVNLSTCVAPIINIGAEKKSNFLRQDESLSCLAWETFGARFTGLLPLP